MDTPAMAIRTMREAERGTVVRLWEECDLTRPWNDPSRDIALAMAAPDATILVGELDGEIVSSTMVGFDGHRGWIYYFGVAPDRRGNGLGRRLFAAAEEWLRSRGAPKVQLMVRDDNRQAIDFYRAMGLEPQPVVTLGRRLDG
jgi:ribosomal protein S18 acetylase RimI-like enzyme